MPRLSTPLSIMMVLSMLAWVAGCAGTPQGPSERARANLEPAAAVAQTRWFDGQTGQKLGLQSVARRAAATDVALIGEMHGHRVGLPAAAALWRAVLDDAGSPALSLEFFHRDHQVALDDYLAGLIDEDTFREVTGRNASNYPAGHRIMVEAAREAGVPVVAANAPRRYVTLARTDGFDRLKTLSAHQRRLFDLPPTLDLGEYTTRFRAVMGPMLSDQSHGSGGEQSMSPEARQATLEGFLRAQTTWDATMADSILSAHVQGHAPVVHVVGRFHVDSNGGTAQLLSRGRPWLDILTIIFVERAGQQLAPEDHSRADVVAYVGPPDSGGSSTSMSTPTARVAAP